MTRAPTKQRSVFRLKLLCMASASTVRRTKNRQHIAPRTRIASRAKVGTQSIRRGSLLTTVRSNIPVMILTRRQSIRGRSSGHGGSGHGVRHVSSQGHGAGHGSRHGRNCHFNFDRPCFSFGNCLHLPDSLFRYSKCRTGGAHGIGHGYGAGHGSGRFAGTSLRMGCT